MKTYIAIGCMIFFAMACARKIPAADIPGELKTTWLTYLKHEPNIDTNRVRFEIKDVYFYADTAAYICQFKVRMQVPSERKDTVGMMGGTISKDFTVVHRTY